MILLFWLIVGALFRAVWHISMFKPKYSWIPQWDYPLNIKRPPLDSMHTYGGLFALWYIFIFLLQPHILWIPLMRPAVSVLEFTASLTFYWLFFFYCFNIFYHIILIKRGYRDWNYLLLLKLFKTKL